MFTCKNMGMYVVLIPAHFLRYYLTCFHHHISPSQDRVHRSTSSSPPPFPPSFSFRSFQGIPIKTHKVCCCWHFAGCDLWDFWIDEKTPPKKSTDRDASLSPICFTIFKDKVRVYRCCHPFQGSCHVFPKGGSVVPMFEKGRVYHPCPPLFLKNHFEIVATTSRGSKFKGLPMRSGISKTGETCLESRPPTEMCIENLGISL